MSSGYFFDINIAEKKCKKPKWLSGEALQIAVKRREAKSKGEKERYKHLNAEWFMWASQVVLVLKNLPTNAGDIRDPNLIP